MERFWCCPAGFAIALALVAGFLIVKSVVEERKEAQKRRMTRIAEDVYNERSKWTAEYVRFLAMEVIDHKLAEKGTSAFVDISRWMPLPEPPGGEGE